MAVWDLLLGNCEHAPGAKTRVRFREQAPLPPPRIRRHRFARGLDGTARGRLSITGPGRAPDGIRRGSSRRPLRDLVERASDP